MKQDNAGGGVRGLRATPTEEVLALVRTAYGIGNETEPVDLGGSSNLNLLICEGGRQWVVRVYRPYVKTERLREIQAIRHTLAATGIPCDGLLHTRDGERWIQVQNRLVEVERFIDHNGIMDSWNALEAGLPILAALHDRLRGAHVTETLRRPLFANHITRTEALSATLRGIERIRRWDPSPKEFQLAAHAEKLAHLLAKVEDQLARHLPIQLVHGDFWDNNVLLRDSKVVFVTDFEFMGARPRIDDLALTLFFACMRYFEDPVSNTQLEQVRLLVNAYSAASETPLTRAERAALPAAIARQPLWSIGGWVRLLDDEEAARRHAAGSLDEVCWALHLMETLDRWQAALA